MIAYFQIIIYLFCIYLIYKGCEIFQTAYVSNPENPKSRKIGIVIGILLTVASVVVSIVTISLMYLLDQQVEKNLKNLNF